MSFQITKCNCNFTDDANVAKYNFVFLNCKLAAVAVVLLLPVYATGTIHCTSVPYSSNSTYLAYFDQSHRCLSGTGQMYINFRWIPYAIDGSIRLIYKNVNIRYLSMSRSSSQHYKRDQNLNPLKVVTFLYVGIKVSDFNMSQQVLWGKCETLVQLLVELRTFPLHAEYTRMHQTFSQIQLPYCIKSKYLLD